MAEKIDKNLYDESKIQTLSPLEHIRLRSGMYIGRLGDGSNQNDGIYILLKEIVDNSIDEFIMGNGKRIDINLDDNGLVSVRDFGRGIPLGKIVECVSIINTGAKYDSDVFQYSVGLNGVGTKAVNALSKHFLVRSYREGNYTEAIFSQGKKLSETKGNAPEQKDGTYIEFIPDDDIFDKWEYNLEYIEQRIWNYAYLNKGLKLYFNKQKFESKRGLEDLLHAEVGDETLYDIGYCSGDRIEIAFTHTNNYGETYFSFVNGQFTADGGSHLSAFREGFLKGVNDFYNKSFSGVDIRDGIAGTVAVKIKDPVFESQTKNKLGNSDIRGWIVNEVKAGIVDFLHKNSTASEALLNKIINNERLRKELNAVKKEAKAAAKKISIKIPKLKDCKNHIQDGEKGEGSMIFLTEGDSASGSMVPCRDVYKQAIFSLRGKPKNLFGKGRAEIYKNEEMYNLMMALGIENDIANLRYSKIIIATDADYDGFHIRNLLLTFFLSYFEELVVSEKIFILETPLFRVRNKKVTKYCYSESERDKALKDISAPEVTRFKGLGEISPKEFGQFIGEDIKLVPVLVKSLKSIPEILEFYMGKNTPQRRDYIMENLI